MADEELELDDDLDTDTPESEPLPADESTATEPEPEQPAEEQTPDVSAEPERQPAPEPRQPSRAETRIRSLTEQIRERDTRLAETNRRIDELIARQSAPQPAPRETPEQRAARFAVMTPQEQIAETFRESEARWEQRMQGFQLQSAETADRTAFQAKCAVDPLYARWAPKVEGRLAELRTKGTNLEREVLLKYLIGEAALDRRSSKDGKREVEKAATRVAAARVRPANSGSDTQPQRRQTQSLERRLENQQI
jgi:hypothetical protein